MTNSKPEINIIDEKFNLIKKVFKTTKAKPKNINELKTLYIMIFKNVIGNLKIIESERTQENKKRFYECNFNIEMFNKIKKLTQRQNKTKYDDVLIDKFKFEFEEVEEFEELEEVEIKPVYKFGKK